MDSSRSRSDSSARGMTIAYASSVSPESSTGTTLRTAWPGRARSTKSNSREAPGFFGTSLTAARVPSSPVAATTLP